jgi:hypothetical protein
VQLSWQQIRDYYRLAAGNATAAMAEEYVHLSAAYQWACDQLDLNELLAKTTVGCQIGVDYVTTPPDAFSVYSVTDVTQQYRLDPEPAGMRGRTRYLLNNGMPAPGLPRYYALQGKRIYLRDTPNAADILTVYYKKQPSAITSSDLSTSPDLLPQQYHWPLVWYAAANYYMLHPDEDTSGDGEGAGRADALMNKAMTAIATPPTQDQKNDPDRREYVRIQGYSFNVGGR